ncbi:MAG: 1-(5-phosphoribosyl)-5-[(5-phosphoribosylamino)methylideneamino]imidazole-4-carboxamide isomerase [Clostridia bacterium]|nr:1-(5-phosphoribosyl)-5-[(5-phosphoribosylamino)methylideneamino]imidazole-4-carboxamide isomerase [Clostridia bacterium]
MYILPAIDLYDRKAVRLFKGDYSNMTVYSTNPVSISEDFIRCGAVWQHVVDLEGAKSGNTDNLDVIKELASLKDIKTEVGGGIRSMEVIEKYMKAGVSRVILGTAAVTDPEFLKLAVKEFKEHVAVGVDLKDNYVAIKGWTEKSAYSADEFFRHICDIGVKTVICTDISKDGAMKGTNHELYSTLRRNYDINLIASGGVSSMDDVKRLRTLDIYGAIIGKAYYEKTIDLKSAVEVAK